jgi:dihydrofolate synthase / folylpolyglutamate synthase
LETEPRLISTELDFLYSRINYEHNVPAKGDDSFRLATMIELLKRLGDPHLRIKAIHVAGTKGKGSIVTMLGSILCECGFKVGVYTSPHLESLCERFLINRRMITDHSLNSHLLRIKGIVSELDQLAKEDPEIHCPTFFEIVTAVAFCWFADENVDWAVLEVGMGGRLDSTNVCLPKACVISNISFDHTGQLGNTLQLIAREKAGIIKSGVPVITGTEAPEALEEIRRIAAQRNAPLFVWKEDFEIDRPTRGQIWRNEQPAQSENLQLQFTKQIRPFDVFGNVDGNEFVIRDMELSMNGRHQMTNAMLASMASKVLQLRGEPITDQCVIRGIAQATIAGRIEFVSTRPDVVLDVAHNVASAISLARWIDDYGQQQISTVRKTLIFGASRDKDVDGLLKILMPRFDSVILTRFHDNPRCETIEKMERKARNVKNQLELTTTIDTDEQCLSAWTNVRRQLNSHDFVCIAGSVFLIAELSKAVRDSMMTS